MICAEHITVPKKKSEDPSDSSDTCRSCYNRTYTETCKTHNFQHRTTKQQSLTPSNTTQHILQTKTIIQCRPLRQHVFFKKPPYATACEGLHQSQKPHLQHVCQNLGTPVNIRTSHVSPQKTLVIPPKLPVCFKTTKNHSPKHHP